MITFYTLLGLTFIVFIHELGHFVVARWAGVKVFTFSIGIGPKLLTLFTDRKGTEYILSLIPLGGYVRMKGQEDIPTEAEQKITDDHYLAKSPFKRLLIILAGVTMNTISAYFFIVLAYSMGVSFSSNKVGGFVPGLTSDSNPLKVGDEIIEVAGKPTESFEDVITHVALTEKDLKKSNIELTVVRDNKELELLVPLVRSTGEVDLPFPQLGITPYYVPEVRNLNQESSLYLVNHLRNGDVIEKLITDTGEELKSLEAISTYISHNQEKKVTLQVLKEETGYQTVETSENVLIGIREKTERGFEIQPKVRVIENYPAAKAGIQDGDVITSLNGQEVVSWTELISQVKVDDRGLIDVDVLRDNKELTITVAPTYEIATERYFLGISQFQEEFDGVKTTAAVSKISDNMKDLVPGIRVGDRIVSVEPDGDLVNASVVRDNHLVKFTYDNNQLAKIQYGYLFDLAAQGKIISYPIFTALQKSVGITIKEFKEVITFFTRLVTGDVPLNVVGGPIAIFEASHQVAETRGWSYFILLFAKISISLAFINMLPIPVLDGGHAVLIVYEMIRGKPMSDQIVRSLQFVGLILLITLMVYVNYNDISRLINR